MANCMKSDGSNMRRRNRLGWIKTGSLLLAATPCLNGFTFNTNTNRLQSTPLPYSTAWNNPNQDAIYNSKTCQSSLTSYNHQIISQQQYKQQQKQHYSRTTKSNTQLNVFWFGGSSTESSTLGEDGESCELVAVRIERTSPNSRRIAGDITVPRPIDDIWAILTDYDNLAIHVPNLVESKQVNPGPGRNNGKVGGCSPGDGNYRCRLYQKGAQKIVGFEFGASVTMDMTESIVVAGNQSSTSPSPKVIDTNPVNSMVFPQDRRIGFKCVDSQFFSEFDGEWRAQSVLDETTGEEATKISYVVDVRPKGPVPVAALEWRIREDVPTNLRAVKKAAVDLGYDGVLALRKRQARSGLPGGVRSSAGAGSRRLAVDREVNGLSGGRIAAAASAAAASSVRTRRNVEQMVGRASNAVQAATSPQPKVKLAPVRVDWYEDETMAAYLKND